MHDTESYPLSILPTYSDPRPPPYMSHSSLCSAQTDTPPEPSSSSYAPPVSPDYSDPNVPASSSTPQTIRRILWNGVSTTGRLIKPCLCSGIVRVPLLISLGLFFVVGTLFGLYAAWTVANNALNKSVAKSNWMVTRGLDVVAPAPGETIAHSTTNSTELLHDLIPSQDQNDTKALEQRAPPYNDACETSDDCDWGYYCLEKVCVYGCEDSTDCLRPQLCRVNSWKCKCYASKHSWCWGQGEFCRTDSECCSGYCEQSSRIWKRCKPRPGEGRYRDRSPGWDDGPSEPLDPRLFCHKR